MVHKTYIPCDFLKPYIHFFWIIDISNKDFSVCTRFPPSGYNLLVFNYKPFVSHVVYYNEKKYISAQRTLYGLLTDSYCGNMKGDGGILGVFFKPGFLYKLLNINMSEIGNTELDAELVIGSEITRLFFLIQEAPTPDLKVKVLETYLINKLKSINLILRPVDNIVSFINEKRGNVKIEEVGKYFKFSNRYLEKNFKQIIGIPPKKYSNIVQFNSVLKDIKDSKKIDWCDIALNGGYYDQQHLINTFSKFTGLPPNKYIHQDNFYNEFFLLKNEMSKLPIL